MNNISEKDIYEKRIQALKEEINSLSKLRIILGSCGLYQEDWVSTDKYLFDITKNEHWERYFKKNSIDNLLAEHVFEHLELEEVKLAFENIYEYLKKGGTFRFATPDGNHPSEFYRDLTKPNGTGAGSDDHKLFFTIDLLREIIDEDKFDIIPIEYFDKDGIFHKHGYNLDNGFIKRTAEHYSNTNLLKNAEGFRKFYDSIPENLRGQLENNNYAYTSLFVDIIKK